MTFLGRADNGGDAVQAPCLRKGGVNLSSASGTIATPEIVTCATDGSITITWNDGGTDTIAMDANITFTIYGAASLVIVSGTFHIG